MSYNWQSASTAEGRERLRELTDGSKFVPVRMAGKYYYFLYAIWFGAAMKVYFSTKDESIPFKEISDMNLDEMEFLDPDDCNELATLKAENKRMQNALLDIEADARAKLAANLPLNSNETMHSVKHGLGRLLENGKSGDIGAVIDAIARTFKGNDDSGA